MTCGSWFVRIGCFICFHFYLLKMLLVKHLEFLRSWSVRIGCGFMVQKDQ